MKHVYVIYAIKIARTGGVCVVLNSAHNLLAVRNCLVRMCMRYLYLISKHIL